MYLAALLVPVYVVFAAQVSVLYINMASLYTLWHIQIVAIVIKDQ